MDWFLYDNGLRLEQVKFILSDFLVHYLTKMFLKMHWKNSTRLDLGD